MGGLDCMQADLRDFQGDFETHITVCLDAPERLVELQEWAAVHGLKCLHIILDRGEHVSQPMLTRHGSGLLRDELAVALELSQLLAAAGFPVRRIKIEAAVFNQGVPQTNEEARGQRSDGYFEHHVKVALESDVSIAAIRDVAEAHSAHLSRNACRQRADGLQERFVTQRCHSLGRRDARRRLDGLLEALANLGHPIVKVEEEYVVYDSNMAVDAGWIIDPKK
jgi:hypothetical protein